MRVHILPDGGAAHGVRLGHTPAGPAASTSGWRPQVVLGASSPGALRLPAAQATAVGMYGPRGVCLHAGGVIVDVEEKLFVHQGHLFLLIGQVIVFRFLQLYPYARFAQEFDQRAVFGQTAEGAHQGQTGRFGIVFTFAV